MSPTAWQSCHDQQDSLQRTNLLPGKLMRDTITFTAQRIKYKKDAKQIWNWLILHSISFLLSDKGAFYFLSIMMQTCISSMGPSHQVVVNRN